jgi:hypothetical protein
MFRGDRAVLGFIALRLEHFRELQIPSLVIRGIGVGDVVGQDFGTLSAEAQSLFVNAERFIEADAHVGKPSGDRIFRIDEYSKRHANSKIPINRGFAGSGKAAMPEKRQPVSAGCRFSAASPFTVGAGLLAKNTTAADTTPSQCPTQVVRFRQAQKNGSP